MSGETPRATIRRVKHDKSYVVIENAAMRDPRLSFKARGLLAYLLTLPDDWKTNRDRLVEQGPDGETAVRNALTELEDAEYLVRKRWKDDQGRWVWDWWVDERPDGVLPIGGKPPDGPDLRKRSESAGQTIGGLSTSGKQPDIRSTSNEVPNEVLPLASVDAKPPKVERNEIFDALVDLFGPASTKTRGSMYGKVVSELVAVEGVTADEVRRRGRVMLGKDWQDSTPLALVKHWDALDVPSVRAPRGFDATVRALERLEANALGAGT